MYKSMIHKIGLLLLAAVTAFSLSACTQQFTQETGNIQQGGFIKLAPGAYDSADTAVVISKQEKQINSAQKKIKKAQKVEKAQTEKLQKLNLA